MSFGSTDIDDVLKRVDNIQIVTSLNKHLFPKIVLFLVIIKGNISTLQILANR